MVIQETEDQRTRVSYEPRVAEFEEALLERLRVLEPSFLEIRGAMGIGNEVGLGSLPLTHPIYTPGALADLRKGPGGQLTYPVNTFFSHEYVPFGPEIRSRIVVIPNLEAATPRIVSIHQRKGLGENFEIETRLLEAADEVYEGVMAHELAHMFELDYQPPQVIEDFKKARNADIEKASDSLEFDPDGESVFDVTAALLGYKEQILAKLYYLISCFRTYQGADDDRRGSLIRTPGFVIKLLEIRIREVLRYCP